MLYLKWKKPDILNYKIWLKNLQCDTDSNLFCVTAAACSTLSVSWLKAPLAAPLSTQWVTALCSQTKTCHAVWAETRNLPGRERLTVSHQTVHHSAECLFCLAHAQKTAFAFVLTDSRDDTAHTQASGSYDNRLRRGPCCSQCCRSNLLLFCSLPRRKVKTACVCVFTASLVLQLVQQEYLETWWYQANKPVYQPILSVTNLIKDASSVEGVAQYITRVARWWITLITCKHVFYYYT